MLMTTLDLFDAQSPAIVGWSLWTWKRTASSRWATLHGMALPAGWKALIDWAVNDDGPRPTPEDARRSMDAFLDAAAFPRLTTDPQLRATLSAHARR